MKTCTEHLFEELRNSIDSLTLHIYRERKADQCSECHNCYCDYKWNKAGYCEPGPQGEWDFLQRVIAEYKKNEELLKLQYSVARSDADGRIETIKGFHEVTDSQGVEITQLRKSLELQKSIADNHLKAGIILAEMMEEMKDTLKKVDGMDSNTFNSQGHTLIKEELSKHEYKKIVEEENIERVIINYKNGSQKYFDFSSIKEKEECKNLMVTDKDKISWYNVLSKNIITDGFKS